MLQQWDTERIVDEYSAFASPKIRDGDVAYIRQFRLADIAHLEFARPPVIVATAAGAATALVGPQHLVRPHKGRLLTIAVVLIFVWQSLNRLTSQRGVLDGM